MSCYILRAESFERLAVSLAAHNVAVAWRSESSPTSYAALAWRASEANEHAYSHRYREPATHHPLCHKHGTAEAWRVRFEGWHTWRLMHGAGEHTGPAPLSKVALVKLLECLAYQIADAHEGSEAAKTGTELYTLAAELALELLRERSDYQAASWGDEEEEEG